MSDTQTFGNETSLVSGLKSGDKKAFSYLYDNYSAALLGVISKSIENEDTANDLLQEVFVKIWKNIASYQPERGRLYTWMLNIARNASIDYMRSAQSKREQVNQNIENSVNSIESSQKLVQETDSIGVRKMLEGLSAEHQTILDYVYFQGYTQDEASKELDLPLGTVKSRVRSAISELRKKLGKEIR